MANTVANLTAVLQMNNTKFKKGLSGSQKALKMFKNQVASVGGMVTGAFAVGSLINFGKEAVQLSAQAEGIKTAFDNLNDATLLDDLKAATRGTVSELELMKQAVRAKNFKVPLKQLATFFEFATNRAIETGESVDYLVNSIIDGIGRKSTLVMDNLGISASELQAEVKKVGDFGAAAANIIEREMGKAGLILDTTATKLARAQAQWKDFKVQAGNALVTAFTEASHALNAIYNPAQFAAENATRQMNEALYEQQGLLRRIAEIDKRFGNMTKLKMEMAAEKERLRNERFKKANANRGEFVPGFLPSDMNSYLPGLHATDTSAIEKSAQGWHEYNSAMSELSSTLDNIDEDLEDILEDPQTASLVAQWQPWAESIARAGENTDNMNKSLEQMRTIIPILSTAFVSLGGIIVDSMRGAEVALEDVAQSLLSSVGAALMQTGNIYAMIVGGVLSLAGGIWDALESPAVAPDYSNTGTSNVNFIIEGRNLVGVMNNEQAIGGVTT